MQNQSEPKTGFFKKLYYMAIVLVVILGGHFLGGKYIRDIDWHEGFSSSPTIGPIRTAGEITSLNEASDYRDMALLSEQGANCSYFIDGVNYNLPSINADYGRGVSRRVVREEMPLPSDTQNILVSGRFWRWQSTLEKDNNSERSISCDADYLLVRKPEIPFLRSLAFIVFYFVYYVGLACLLYKFQTRSKKKKQS